MLKSVVILVAICGVCMVSSNPQHQRRQLIPRQYQNEPVLVEEVQRPKVYETHREISPNIGDGSFRYYSQTSDGLESEQVGHFRNPLQSQVHQGSYTTTDEHGQVVRVNYIADKDGFRPIDQNGASVLPTPPPVPEELVRATADILEQQKTIRDQHLHTLRSAYALHGR